MTERQFLLAVTLVFIALSLVPHRAALFLTSLSIALHRQPLLWWYILLVCSILLKKKYLKKEEDITGLLKVTVTEGCIMEVDSSRETFGFQWISTRRPATVNT